MIMRTAAVVQKVLATSLAIMFSSCSATRHSAAGPMGPGIWPDTFSLLKSRGTGRWRTLGSHSKSST